MSLLDKSIQETFRDIVGFTGSRVLSEVNSLLTTSEGKAYSLSEINYHYGHSIEISNIMRDYTTDKTLRTKQFPLIWLEEDLRGAIREDFEKVYLKRIVIAWASEKNYESNQREAHSFIPVLRPIYREFIRQIARHKRFRVYDKRRDMPHEYFERKYWGTESEAKDVFSDYVDAIEIRNLELTVTPNNCR